MKNKGVQYVMMIADNAQMADFLKAMKTQGFEPQVIEFMPQAYSQSFVDLGGAAVDGSYVWANFALLEEADANPQMALYQEWLEKTHPGATPDIFGVYAWGAGEMFVEALRNSGPEATRAGVLKSLSEDFIDWNADGFMGTSSPSTRTPSRCFALMQVQDGKFVRVYPEEPGAFECELGALREVQPNL
jgi:ABC-type branched-subunit amino acid transport system substrate-binding protein